MTTHRKIYMAAALAGLVCAASPASAEDPEAKAAFKAMSEFLVAQPSISASYDATLEIVTDDLLKVGLATSGNISFTRPDKIRMTRTGGMGDVELVYDGKVLSAYGKSLNIFGKVPLEGTVEDAVEKLRNDSGLELPAADLLSSDPYNTMMENVTDARAIGEGMIHGQMCDHIAFRTNDVDWQIWIAQGDKPFPCRFTITSKLTIQAPSYSIEFSGWKSGTDVATDDYQLKTAADAKEISISELKGLDEVDVPVAEGGVQ